MKVKPRTIRSFSPSLIPEAFHVIVTDEILKSELSHPWMESLRLNALS